MPNRSGLIGRANEQGALGEPNLRRGWSGRTTMAWKRQLSIASLGSGDSRQPSERRIAMCYEWLYLKSTKEKVARHEQSKGATERLSPVSQPAQPAPISHKPKQIETELDPV